MRQKLFAGLLTLCLALGLVPSIAFADESAPNAVDSSVTISGSSETVKGGEQVTVTWNIANNPGIGAFQCALSFDEDRLSLVDVELGDAISYFGSNWDEVFKSGWYKFGGDTVSGITATDGSFVKATFDTTNARNGDYKVELIVEDLGDETAQFVSSSTSPATITVTDVQGSFLDEAEISDVKDQVIEIVTEYSGSGGSASTLYQAMVDHGGYLPNSEILQARGAEPTFTLTLNDAVLTEGVDYEVSYENNENIGTATATFTGKEGTKFEGQSVSKDFNVVGYLNSKAVKVYYHGERLTPEQRAMWNDDEICTLPTRDEYELPTADNVGKLDSTGASVSSNPHDGATCNGAYFYSVSGNYDCSWGQSPVLTGDHYVYIVQTNAENGALEVSAVNADSLQVDDWMATTPHEFTGGSYGSVTLHAPGDNLLSDENMTIAGNCNGGEWECRSYLSVTKLGSANKYLGYEDHVWTTGDFVDSVDSSTWNNSAIRFIYSGDFMAPQVKSFYVSSGMISSDGKTTLAITDVSGDHGSLVSLMGYESATDVAKITGASDVDWDSFQWKATNTFYVLPSSGVEISLSEDFWNSLQSLIDRGYVAGSIDSKAVSAYTGKIFVYPYDLSSDCTVYAGARFFSSEAKQSLFANIDYKGTSTFLSDMPHGVTFVVNGSKEGSFVIPGNANEPVDILKKVEVLDAWGSDVLTDKIAQRDIDYAVELQKKDGEDWIEADIDNVTEAGEYRLRLVGNSAGIKVNGNPNGEALYAGTSDWCEFTVTADMTALNAAIAKAEETAKDAVVSEGEAVKDLANGAHYWTRDAKSAFDSAISAAKEVCSNINATQLEVDEATATLNAAIDAFNVEDETGAAGYKVAATDFSKLEDAIKEANELKDSVVESANGKDVPNGKQWATAENINEFAGVIEQAQSVVDKQAESQNSVDALYVMVGNAKDAFEEVIGTAESSKIDLQTSITSAESKLSSVVESDDGSDVSNGSQWATKADRDALLEAVAVAKEAADNDELSQNEVDVATQELDAAIAKFNEATNTAKTDYSVLDDLVDAVLKDAASVLIADDAKNVYLNKQWVTQRDADALKQAVNAAQSGLTDGAASQDDIDALITDLKAAQATFDNAKQQGTKPLPVESVSVIFDTAYTSDTAQASAQVLPKGCETGVEWSSSDSSIASIDANGVITAHKDGVVTITATSTAAEVASDKVRTGSAQFAVIGMGEHATLADEGTGTVVEGAPSGTVLVVSDASDDLMTTLASNQACIGAYEIDLYATDANGNPAVQVQPDGSLTITLTVDEGFAGKAVTVYVYHSDGTTETINAVVSDDNTVTLTGIDKLSRFEVVAATEAGTATEQAGNEVAKASGDVLCATGDNTMVVAVCAVAAIVAAFICVMMVGRVGKRTRG